MKHIKLLLPVFIFLSSLHSNASGIKFITGKTWKEILQIAKKENKLIFLDAYASWCGPCKYLQSSVFTDNNVGVFYNDNFINVKMDMEEGEGIQLSENLGVESYPTLFFIDAEGSVVHKKLGAMDAGNFLELGKIASDPEKQFYTIKKRIVGGDISSRNFHDWIHEAESIGDPDTDSIITTYLKSKKLSLSDKDLAEIMIDHANLNKEQIDFIFNNKDKLIGLLERTPDEFNSSLLKAVRNYSTDISLKSEKMDFTLFQSTIKKYFPEHAISETSKIKIRYYNYMGETATSLNELAKCITSYNHPLKISDIADLILAYSDQILQAKRTDEFIQKVLSYKLTTTESNQTYCKNLALLALYLKLKDENNVRIYGNKILQDSNAPADIKENVREVL
jgi:thioredoxin-related protein